VTEINPDHADPEGAAIGRFITALVSAISGA
jgi:hypothetical protein